MRKIWRFVKEILEQSFFEADTEKTLNKFLFLLLGGLFVLHFSSLASLGFSLAESRAIVAANDDDTQAAIGLAGKTYLINDNGARAYGPVYYRIESLLRLFPLNHYWDRKDNQEENRERNIHFHFVIINLISVYATAFLLIRLFTKNTFYSGLGTLGLTGVFLANDWRAKLVFMGKPDHLFSFFLVLAFLQTLFWLRSIHDKKNLLKASSAWALALSTKLSGLFFLPAALILLPWRKWSQTRSYILYFFLSLIAFYFLIGFPQNFDLLEYGRYLIQQNTRTSLVSFEFLSQQWWPLVRADLSGPLLFMFFYFLALPPSVLEKNYRKESSLFLTFSVLAYITLLAKQTTSPFQWYTFPFSYAVLFGIALALGSLLKPLKEKMLLPLQSLSWRGKKYCPQFLLLFAVPYFSGLYPQNYWNQYLALTSCRIEAQHFKSLIDEQARSGKKIMVDANVPYDRSYHDKEVWMTYEMKTSLFQEKNPDFIALKQNYYVIYLPRKEGGLELGIGHTSDLEDTRNFYRLFFNKKQAQAPDQSLWEKNYTDSCGNELWKKMGYAK